MAHTYWRLRGFRADLIVLNQEGPSYDRPFHQQLLRQIEAHSSEAGIDKPGGVFLRDWHAIPEEHRHLLLGSFERSAARRPRFFAAATGVGRREPRPCPLSLPVGGTQEVPSAPLPFLELPYFNGLGGFTGDGARICDLSEAGQPALPRPG